MKIALVHYHLEPGGVTRVLENTIQSWKDSGKGPDDWVILSGRPYTGKILDQVRVVEGLDYATLTDSIDPNTLRLRMEDAARDALGQLPDLWHVHNHSLGKNCLVPHVVARLAREDERIVLQIHDLAEQGRPANYQLVANCRTLYPFSPRIRYAFLNSRDRDIFTAAGLPPENATLLPNPVSTAPLSDSPADSPSPILFAQPANQSFFDGFCSHSLSS